MTTPGIYFALVLALQPGVAFNVFDNAEDCAIIANNFKQYNVVAGCIPTTYYDVVASTQQLHNLSILINGHKK